MKAYQCPVCKLHYESEDPAKQCAEFCKKFHGCSLEITKHSVEHKEYMKKQGQSS